MPRSMLRIGALSLLLGAGLADAAQASPRAQLMYTVGSIPGSSKVHVPRPSDVTMKRGIVGSQHPDFMWSPQRMQPQTEGKWKTFRGGGLR